MSNEVEFPCGEYKTPQGAHLKILALDGWNRWVWWADNCYRVYTTEELCQMGLKPYTPPVVVERWVAIHGTESDDAGFLWPTREDLAHLEKSGIVKLTFEDGKLVKAEVEK